MSQQVQNNGMYAVGDKLFFNKVNAILEDKISNRGVEYRFHDEIYSKHNWSVEPEESLESLYARRAWELRNKYDYLVLHFSGGSDSANVLETFIKNKIPLDEIFIRGPISKVDKNINNTDPSNMFAEVFLNAIPIAEYVKKYFLPNVRISVKDTSQFSIDYFKNNKEWFSPDKIVPAFTPHIAWCTQLDVLDPTYVKLTEAGKRVAHIVGIDKPMVYYENNQFVVKFLDQRVYLSPLGFLSHTMKVPMFQEPFYWSTSTAKLIIKQSHAVKNFIKNTGIDPGILNRKMDRAWHDFMAGIIYKRTLPLYFVPQKSPGGMVQPWDRFFFAEGLLSSHGKSWFNGISELSDLIPDHWKHEEDRPLLNDSNSIKGIFSKSYYIGN